MPGIRSNIRTEERRAAPGRILTVSGIILIKTGSWRRDGERSETFVTTLIRMVPSRRAGSTMVRAAETGTIMILREMR